MTTPTVLLSVLLTWACSGAPATPESSPDEATPPAEAPVATGPSVVLITLDTTRVDRLGAYGHAPADTPVFDQLTAQGIRFDRAYSTIPLTTPSHASIMTGLYPPRHGIRNNGDAILPEEATTLAELLSGVGYDTVASISAFVTTRVWNLDQGFTSYFDEIQTQGPRRRWGQERPADQVVDDLLGWMNERTQPSQPFFMWAHFFDAHHPHTAPEPYLSAHEDAYDAEIAFVDAQIGRLREAVEASAGDAGVIWVILADHGESFGGEHGEQSHGMYLFDPTMHIPFIIRPATPLSAPVVEATTAVSTVDVTPTILAMLGQPVPEDLDGRDLSSALTGTLSPREPVYMESLTAQSRFGYHPELAAVSGAWKLMDTPSPRLFDVVADPAELTNRYADAEATQIDALRTAIQQAWGAPPISANMGSTASPEMMEQLAALGYISNDFEHGDALSQVDAKDRVDIITTLENIRAQMQEGLDPDAAEQAYKALLIAEPTLGEARMGLAQLYSAQGKNKEAIQTYRDALSHQPTSLILKVNLANALAADNQHEAGLAEMMAALEQVPGDNLAQTGVLRMLADLDRQEEGIAMARQWLQDKPDDPMLQAHLGVMLVQKGEYEEAETLLRASLSDDVPRQLVSRTLGAIEIRKNHLRRGLWFYRKELEFFPSPELRMKTAQLCMRMREWSEAAEHFSTYVEHASPQEAQMARLPWAQAVFNQEEYAQAREILAPTLQAMPNHPDVLLLQANILAKIGDRAEAEAMAARANELNRSRVEQMQQRAQQPPGAIAPSPSDAAPQDTPPPQP